MNTTIQIKYKKYKRRQTAFKYARGKDINFFQVYTYDRPGGNCIQSIDFYVFPDLNVYKFPLKLSARQKINVYSPLDVKIYFDKPWVPKSSMELRKRYFDDLLTYHSKPYKAIQVLRGYFIPFVNRYQTLTEDMVIAAKEAFEIFLLGYVFEEDEGDLLHPSQIPFTDEMRKWWDGLNLSYFVPTKYSGTPYEFAVDMPKILFTKEID